MIRHLFRAAGPVMLCVWAGCVPSSADDWPQWRGANRDGVWKETGIIGKFTSAEIPVKWRAPISNGYSGPTVANGRVYVTDRVTDPSQQERVHCFDADTGKKVWSYAYGCVYKGVIYPDGPRASVTIFDSRAYSLGSMANLHCFEAATGKVLWSKDLYSEYKVRMPDWGIAAAPLIEGDLLIVMISGEPNACLVAFDRKTGKETWRALPDKATYSAPIVINQAGKRVLVCWTAERIVGLDPSSGKLYWEVPNHSVANIDGVGTPVTDGNLLFVSSVYEGSLLIRLSPNSLHAEKVWLRHGKGEDMEALHSLIATPVLRKGYIYGIDYYGELRCLDAKNGDRVWEDKTVVPRAMWGGAHLIQHGDRDWILNERGQLIIAKLTPKGYQEFSRAQLIKPTRGQLNQRGGVAWSHPAFANKHIFARNDAELICASLKATGV